MNILLSDDTVSYNCFIAEYVSSFCYQLWGYTSPYILSIVIISLGSQVRSGGQIVCSFHFLGGQIWCMFLFVLCYVTSVMSDSCDPMDCSLSVSSVHVTLQARTLGCIAISFSRGQLATKQQQNSYRPASDRQWLYLKGQLMSHLLGPPLCAILKLMVCV